MDTNHITKHFAAIGARLKVLHWNRNTLDINVLRDRRGECFQLTLPRGKDGSMDILQALPHERHLLLLADSQRFLCGHDERHWFVAAIDGRVSTVRAAKASLLPTDLKDAAKMGATFQLRRNKRFIRQGEWFFVATDRDLSGMPIHRNEPLQRNTRSKPHRVEELVRFGGEVVHLVKGREYSDAEYREQMMEPSFRRGRHETRVKNPEVYARGTVRHSDHATILLKTWHRVHLNSEMVSGSVSFYD